MEKENEPIEVTIEFHGKFSIAQSGLSEEDAIKDTMDEFHRFIQDLHNHYDYILITDFDKPKIEKE